MSDSKYLDATRYMLADNSKIFIGIGGRNSGKQQNLNKMKKRILPKCFAFRNTGEHSRKYEIRDRLNKLSKGAFVLELKDLFYGCSESGNWTCLSNLSSFGTSCELITEDEFLEMTYPDPDTELIGYKFKEFVKDIWLEDLFGGSKTISEEYDFIKDSVVHSELESMKILDIWCYPVYKKKENYERDFLINCPTEVFSVVANRKHKSVLYSDIIDSRIYELNYLKDIVKDREGWKPTTVSIGCKEGIPVEEIKEIIKFLES